MLIILFYLIYFINSILSYKEDYSYDFDLDENGKWSIYLSHEITNSNYEELYFYHWEVHNLN